MLSVLEETVLPGEVRAIDVTRLAPAAVAWLAAQPVGATLLLVPVTAHAEVPLLVGGRHASIVRLLSAPNADPTTPDASPSVTFEGVDRVRITRAFGQAVPHQADVQPGSATTQSALGPLVLEATVALAAAPLPLSNPDPWRALGATLVRELGGPGAARRALAEGDLATLLAELISTHMAESAGREALLAIEDKLRLLAAEPKLSKGLRQRLHSAVVEVSRRLDLYDTHTAKDDDLDELDQLRRKIDQGHLPLAARQVAERELRLLRSTRADNHDYPTHLRLLQLIARLAWHPDPLPPIDLARVSTVLERDHAGLERPKRRILEYLAVRALGGDARSTVLCLAGPPGVGKTSIARAMAEALGRPFLRIALGGVNDQSELRGHRITYTAARPGRIIEGLAQVRSRSALVLLDELDKVGTDRSRDVTGPLLEILDPEQNHAFSDNFLQVPYDLSDCLFIATANDLSRMPDYLKDRLEILELDGYATREKVAIATTHLAPGLAREHGIPALSIDDATLAELVEGWTREAGVRQLRRELAAFYRERAVERLLPTSQTPPDVLRPILSTDLPRVLGPRRHRPTDRSQHLPPGVVTGLSVSGHGGELLRLEVVALGTRDDDTTRTGQLHMTGSLGEVMKESARTIRAHLAAHAARYGISARAILEADFHLHAPEAAVPKDGPSAGAALFLALLSVATQRPVRADLALSGELDLSGRVLAVGGIRQKCLAAERAGMALVLLPRANEADVPKDLRVPVVFVDTTADLLQAFVI